MIEPIKIGVAYKAATTALDLVKKGISLHKDSQEVGNYLADYFNKKDELLRLEKEKKKQEKRKLTKSIQSEAIERATYEYNLRKQEMKLKEQMQWAGLGDLWRDIQKKKIEIKREREREEAQRKAKIQKIKDLIAYTILIIGLLGITGWIFYALFSWVATFRD